VCVCVCVCVFPSILEFNLWQQDHHQQVYVIGFRDHFTTAIL
jgi:hypothetical protein